MKSDPIFSQELLDWFDDVIRHIVIVVVHMIGRDEFADLAAAVRLKGIRVGHVDQLVVHAVDNQNGTFDALDQIDVPIPLGKEVTQDLADAVFGNFPQRLEWGDENQASHVGSLLGYVTRWTGTQGSPHQNDILVGHLHLVFHKVVYRQAVLENPISIFLANEESIA